MEHQYTRQTVLIALGGGVVGDITGYVAATYQRGINFIQLPTTMLALVDSSVGGKTAVNHTLGKNMIGAFHQPIAVISELDFLSTLPEREYLSGLAEVIKYGIIADVEFFKWLQVNVSGIRSRNDDLLEQLILKSCETKAQIVSEDEKEKGIRAILNLGHTFGHAIETLQNYQGLLHGEAVSVGTAMASHLSCALGLISKDDHSQILDLLAAFGLPIGLGGSFSIEAFRQAMSLDKKNTNGQLRLVLVNKIGCAQVFVDVDEKLITATLKYFLIDNGVRN